MADISEKFGLNYLLKEGGKLPDGFTLRDLFAAFALAGIAAANMDQDYSTDAAMAYNYADEMLAQRGKGKRND